MMRISLQDSPRSILSRRSGFSPCQLVPMAILEDKSAANRRHESGIHIAVIHCEEVRTAMEFWHPLRP